MNGGREKWKQNQFLCGSLCANVAKARLRDAEAPENFLRSLR